MPRPRASAAPASPSVFGKGRGEVPRARRGPLCGEHAELNFFPELDCFRGQAEAKHPADAGTPRLGESAVLSPRATRTGFTATGMPGMSPRRAGASRSSVLRERADVLCPYVAQHGADLTQGTT